MHSLVLVSLLQCSVVFANLLYSNWCDSGEESGDLSLHVVLVPPYQRHLKASEIFYDTADSLASSDFGSNSRSRHSRSLSKSAPNSGSMREEYTKIFAFAGRAATSLATADQNLIAKLFVQEYEKQHPPFEGDQRSDGQKFFEYVEAGIFIPDDVFDQNVRRFNQWWSGKYGPQAGRASKFVNVLVEDIFHNTTIPEIFMGYDFSAPEEA